MLIPMNAASVSVNRKACSTLPTNSPKQTPSNVIATPAKRPDHR